MSSAPSKNEDLSFEAALEELQSIVEHLEKGELKLDDAIAKYERGVVLKSLCEQKLKNAKQRIQTLEEEYKNAQEK